jgi:hypothetical protein
VDLLGEDLAQRPTEDREVLGEHAHPPAVDGPEPGHDPVGVRAVLLQPHAVGPVAGQHVELLERPLVQQVVEALPGGHLSLGVLALDRGRAPGVQGLFLTPRQIFQPLDHGVLHEPRG